MKMTRSEFLRLAGASVAASMLARTGLAPAAEAPVARRPIPSSGEPLPVIGVGTAVIYETIEPSDPKFPGLVDTMRTFLANGGTLIDTSPSYGRAEKNVGEIFRRIGGRGPAFVATKISTSGEASGVGQANAAFQNLGIEKIDLLQVHNIRDTQTHLRTIRRLKDEGKVRYVGITTSFDNQYDEFERVMKSERLDFIQVDYALDNRNAEERILPLARDRGMAVLVNLPFGRGRLLSRARGRELPPFARDIDATGWPQIFLKWILGNPAINAVIPGTDRPEFALDNLNAGRGRFPDAKLRQEIVRYWENLA